jgi:hypothetical protein
LLLVEIGLAILIISWLPLKLLKRFLSTRPNAPSGYDSGSIAGYRFGIGLGLALIGAGIISSVWSLLR